MEGEKTISTEVKNEMPTPKIRHDWYQTDTHVIVTILIKNVKNVKVENGETTLSVSAKLPTGNEYSLELDLANPVIPKQCPFKIAPSKIEIKLTKRDCLQWSSLEGNAVEKEPVKPIPAEILQASNQHLKYPTSSKKVRNWDQIEKEIEKQEAEEKSDDATALFQKIYGSSSDEVRRAMNKSFLESGGTVLSTNWSEVGKGTVERKPPDGMEWKSWDS